ncbi:MAG: T9SS type A sorting domain-containing protein, partial [Calditrichaeota bacterium]|nr:T9SS type A sorting domain-containing protein [Calditrichota bacterium]
QDLFSTIDGFRAQNNRNVAINEFGAMRWQPGVADFMDDEMNLMEQKGINYALWLWETSWQEYAQEVDAFNFRHGPNPNHHSDVSSSDLITVIRNHWAKNTVRPSNFYGNKYYVSVNGNDGDNGMLPQTAWRTIPHALSQVTAGDTIQVLAGSYGSFTVNKSGQDSNVIVIRGVGADQVTVQGIEIGKNVQFVTISDMTVQGFSNWGVFVRGTNRYIVFQRLRVFGGESGIHLTWGYSGQNPEDGAVSNITIEDCVVANCIYTAIDGTPGPCDSLTFRNLEVYGAGISGQSFWGSDGIAIERGDYILVENCYVHDNGGDGIDLCSRNYSGHRQGILVRGNRVLRNHQNGIKLWAGGRMENNFLGGMGNTPVDIGAIEGTYEIINNTIACNMRDSSYSVRNYAMVAAYPNDDTGVSASIQLTMLNNIFAFNCSDQMGGPTGVYLGAGVNLVSEGYNCYFSREDGEIQAEFVSGDTWFTRQQVTDGTWHTKTGQGAGDICLDPKFAAGDSFDFRLQQGSPGIDAGDPAAGYNDKDGSRNDMGGYGGSHGESYQYPGPANNFSISGVVTYFGTSFPVADVNLFLAETDTATANTDNGGGYRFGQVAGGKNYLLTPLKDDAVSAETIISYDASLAARLALDLLPDTSACQRLAADCDQNGSVQMFDASLIARYAVGLNDVAGSFAGIWGFDPQSRNFISLNQNQENADFAAYVIGDVDGSWPVARNNGSGGNATSDWITFNQKPDENLEISFLGTDTADIFAFDAEVTFDSEYFSLVSVSKTNFSENFTLTVNDQISGKVRAGGYRTESVSGNNPLLKVELHSLQSGNFLDHIHVQKYFINQFDVLKNASAVKTQKMTKIPPFSMEQNYPNPFNQTTRISYNLPQTMRVRITVLDITGRTIKVLADEMQSAGAHLVFWDGRNEIGKSAASGVYWYRIKAGNISQTRKLILLR